MNKTTGSTKTTITADEAALVAAARTAQRESDGFTAMHHTVGAVNETVELLYQMIRPGGDAPEDVNWCVVLDLLEDARRRLGGVYCATGVLAGYEREAEGEAA